MRNPGAKAAGAATGGVTEYVLDERELITPRPPSATPPLRAARGTVVPPDFDRSRLPVLAQHWYGIAPVVDGADAASRRDLQFQRDVEGLLSPRRAAELGATA